MQSKLSHESDTEVPDVVAANFVGLQYKHCYLVMLADYIKFLFPKYYYFGEVMYCQRAGQLHP